MSARANNNLLDTAGRIFSSVRDSWNRPDRQAQVERRPEPMEGGAHILRDHLPNGRIHLSRSEMESFARAYVEPYLNSGAGIGDPVLPEPEPGSAEWRKRRPLKTGVLDYFPDALLEVAYASWAGNNQHNPGQPLHWAKHKSTDEHDALIRHVLEAGRIDSDGVRHSAKVAWRALAALQREIEKERG